MSSGALNISYSPFVVVCKYRLKRGVAQLFLTFHAQREYLHFAPYGYNVWLRGGL